MIAFAKFIVELVIVITFTFIALFIYALFQEPELINALYCKVNTNSDLSFHACYIIKNSEL